MTKPSDKRNNFDELISSTLGRNELKFDFDKWQQDHPDSVRLYQSKTQNRSTPAAKWRFIMDIPIRKWLPTAAVAAIVIILFNILPSNHNGGVFADVIEAMSKITCYKGITESFVPGKDEPVSTDVFWTDYTNKETYCLFSGKYIHHYDDKDHTHKIYVPEKNTLTIDLIEYEHLGNSKSCEKAIEEFVKKQNEEGIEVTQREDIIDGKDVEIVEMLETLNDIGDDGMKTTKMLMAGQHVKYDKFVLVIDRETSLIISHERYCYNHDKELLVKKVTRMIYDADFPKDIHELGMPEDVKIINKVPSKKVQETRKAILKYQNDFLDKYVAVITESEVEDDGAERIIRAFVVNSHGKNLRVDEFWANYGWEDMITPNYKDRLKKSLYILKEFCPDLNKVYIRSVRFYDGLWQQNFDANDHALSNKEDMLVAKEKQRRPDGDGRMNDDIADFGWKLLWHNLEREHDYEDEFSKKNNLIALEMASEGRFSFYLPRRQVLYVDPEKDYLMKRYISQELLDAYWMPDDKWKGEIDKNRANEEVMTTEVVEYGQTKGGQWYPKVMTIKGYRQPLRQNAFRIPTNRIVRIHLIEENQKFDKELFTPWKLEQ